MVNKKNILSLDVDELSVWLGKQNEQPYRAKQIFSWLHKKQASAFSEMINIPGKLRGKLYGEFEIFLPKIENRQQSKDGTVKYLFELRDGKYIESVFMSYHHGNTLCVSSQAGCRMGCKFCASTKNGLERNLETAEILGQVYMAVKDTGKKVNNVVLMGMGEPLDNFDNVIKFLSMVTSSDGYGMSIRHISLSTCGVVPGIYKLAEKKLGITLSISLHSPFDEKRSQIMPINAKYNLSLLIKACKDYFEKTGRRISFEYTMLSGFNDRHEDAKELARLIKGMGAHVNLIPVNSVEGSPFVATAEEKVAAFQKTLTDYGLNATVRRKLGTDIDAACGQLKARKLVL